MPLCVQVLNVVSRALLTDTQSIQGRINRTAITKPELRAAIQEIRSSKRGQPDKPKVQIGGVGWSLLGGLIGGINQSLAAFVLTGGD